MKLTSVNRKNIEILEEYDELCAMFSRLRSSEFHNITMQFSDDKGSYGSLVIDKKEAMEFLNKRIKALEAKIKSF